MEIIKKNLKFSGPLKVRTHTTEIILHCTASKEGQDWSVESIHRLHLKNGWSGIGYNFVIGLDGTVYECRPVDRCGAHTVGHNSNSVGVCYVGGVDKNGRPKDTRTEEQKKSMYELVMYLKQMYPTAVVHCHNEFANKACPSFKIGQFIEELKEKNDTI